MNNLGVTTIGRNERRILSTSLFVRDFLLSYKESYPYQIWKNLKTAKKGLHCCSYQSFMNLWGRLEKLDLVIFVREEKGLNPTFKNRKIYTLNPQNINSNFWKNTAKALYG